MEGRMLLGIGQAEDTLRFLLRQTRDELDVEDFLTRDRAARAIRAKQSETATPFLLPMPPEWQDHLHRVRARPVFQRVFGSREVHFGLVDLASLIVIQPHVHFGYAETRVPLGLTNDEVVDLCLPDGPGHSEVWGGVTTTGQGDAALTLMTHDLNLTVIAADFQADGLSATFRFGRTSVFTQVVRYHGRHYLKDGTHRAVGLLARRHRCLPAVIVDTEDLRDIPDHLPSGVLLTAGAPRVREFLDPRLYYPHRWETRVKVVRIRVDDFIAPHE